MKNLYITAALLMVLLPMAAQKIIEKHIDLSENKALFLNIQIADSVSIHTWKKPEVYAKVIINIDENKDNEAYLVSFDSDKQDVKINARFDDEYFKGREKNNVETMISWELFIPEKTDLTVESINANITIRGVTSDIRAKTISGFIDWMIMPDLKADLHLKTITGTFYSNLDTQAEQLNNFPPELKYTLNSGGSPVTLETISGDIFCRKYTR